MKSNLVALTILFIASTAVNAASITESGKLGISNQTTKTLSFKVNNICSSNIGNVDGYSIRTVSISGIMKSCGDAATCDITGYSQPNCSGASVGGVKIDFANRSIGVFADGASKVGIAGSIGANEYNIFYFESKNSN